MSHVIKFPLSRPAKGLAPLSNPDAEALAKLQSGRDDMLNVFNFLEDLRARLLALSTDEEPVAALSSKALPE